MSETHATPPAEGASAPVQFDVSDERSAAAAIEGFGLLEDGAFESAGDDNQDSGQKPGDGAPETAPTGEEEGHSEAPQAPIAPPASWADEHKALFSKLPPETQKVIADRESAREAALTRSQQEAAEHRKAIEVERTAVTTERTQYLQNLNQLLHLAAPEAKQFEGVDWAKLSAEQPAEYVRLSGLRDQLRARINGLQGEMQRVGELQKQEQTKRSQDYLGEQRKLLVEKLPEFGDAEKGQKLTSDLRQHLQTVYGFTPEEIGGAADHRQIMMAVDAMRWRQAEAARKVAETKRANPAPQVQPPGNSGGDDGPGKRFKEKVQQLGRTNSARDAASILMDLV